MKSSFKLPIFSIVNCRYRGRSAGIILEYSDLIGREHVAYMLLLLDKRGNELRLKPIVMYSTHWLSPATQYYKEKVINLLEYESNYWRRSRLMMFPQLQQTYNERLPKIKHLPSNLLYALSTKDRSKLLEHRYFPSKFNFDKYKEK